MTTFLVPATTRRERADKVLAQAFPGHSRAAFQRALEAGLVKADGKEAVRGDARTRLGGHRARVAAERASWTFCTTPVRSCSALRW